MYRRQKPRLKEQSKGCWHKPPASQNTHPNNTHTAQAPAAGLTQTTHTHDNRPNTTPTTTTPQPSPKTTKTKNKTTPAATPTHHTSPQSTKSPAILAPIFARFLHKIWYYLHSGIFCTWFYLRIFMWRYSNQGRSPSRAWVGYSLHKFFEKIF